MTAFRAVLVRLLGLAWEASKSGFLADVLDRRSRANGQPATAYVARLGTERWREELDALAQELTVGETYFFRNLAQFHALAQTAIPDLLRGNPGHRLRVLSAGCSSGEEAYSIAIVLRDAMADGSIRAIDLNPLALARAMRARFTTWSLRETPPHQQASWFRVEGREVHLDDRIREMVTFEQRNLAADDPELWRPGGYDIVFCRNVLMYFSPDAMRQVVRRLELALAPGGYLFLGHAETLHGMMQGFELCHTHGTFYYRRAAGPHRTAGVANAPSLAAPLGAATVAPDDWVAAIGRAAERIRAITDPGPEVRSVGEARGWDLGEVLELLRSERFLAALELLEALPAQAAGDAEVMLVRSTLLAHSGQFAGAEAGCRQLLAIDPRNAGAYYVLALCREHAGDLGGALEHDHTATRLDPGFAMPRLHLGLLARRAGDREAARRELGQAVHLLEHETAARLALFGGGFERPMLIALCRDERDGAPR